MSPSRNNSIIIFDWDDTICPSSFVDRAGVDNYKKLPKRVSLFLFIVYTSCVLLSSVRHLTLLRLCYSFPHQCHNLFTEIEKCTEKCLAEAAKYGEVSVFVAIVHYYF